MIRRRLPNAPGAAPGKRSASQDFAERAIYDGLKFLGSFAPTKAGVAAYDRTGKPIGVFEDVNAARLAITLLPFGQARQ